jgi:hypothetical protein
MAGGVGIEENPIPPPEQKLSQNGLQKADL